ncbi:MAG: hypothetical protein A2508_04745 [Candidatus Lambdaproteobacteria bacterium RIFOXYD12_FULL_49_8]|uniref:Uncharacterized protein n=1 Tax=Candidatus Lambdaproteobacteria bacterium RIFOXYD2_FULL_50_16 TaxID=1817772 RepID=A0A1F6G7N1_9PROT|nr:MAG: hypothetical protein A2527_09720 [Candidatus Lambdaproteobacteria bacterium RIFOXYD2_FULL_50_16]OGG97801.1 MAG: hypothetical protein A2508_04745 [Candidatus Lambdaproteobacteria bacterium RIFOXYD12_FULL_49_8]
MFCFTLSLPLLGQEKAAKSEPTEALKPNVVELGGGYQIFPAEQAGNSLYHQKKRIFTRQGFSVRAILAQSQGLLFYGLDQEGKEYLEILNPEDGAKLEPLEGGYYLFIAKGGISRVLRVYKGKEIQDLLAKSNTAGNFVYNGVDAGVFSHITGGEQVTSPDGKTQYLYSFKLHVVYQDREKITNLAPVVTAYSSKLDLRWVKKDQIEYRSIEGKVERLNIH